MGGKIWEENRGLDRKKVLILAESEGAKRKGGGVRRESIKDAKEAQSTEEKSTRLRRDSEGST